MLSFCYRAIHQNESTYRCPNRTSTDQYHMTESPSQVYQLFESQLVMTRRACKSSHLSERSVDNFPQIEGLSFCFSFQRYIFRLQWLKAIISSKWLAFNSSSTCSLCLIPLTERDFFVRYNWPINGNGLFKVHKRQYHEQTCPFFGKDF